MTSRRIMRTMTITTLTENSNAHGTERLIALMANETPDGSRVAEVAYRLGDAGGYLGVVDHETIEQDADGDYVVDGSYHETLTAAVDAARAALERRASR